MHDKSPNEAIHYSRKLLSCCLGVAVLPLIVIITLHALSLRTESAGYGTPRQPETPTHHRSLRLPGTLCGPLTHQAD
jgi:hypothetical protein